MFKGVTKPPRAAWRGIRYDLRRLYYTTIHRFAKQPFTWSETLAHVLIVLLWISPILLNQYITWQHKRQFGVGFVAMYLFLNFLRSWRDFRPMIWLKARDDHAERNIGFARLLRLLATGSAYDAKRHDFQTECLYLIANYVRSWRRDIGAKKIFANLLVIDHDRPDVIEVVARDREGVFDARPMNTPRQITALRIGECVATGRRCVVGDLTLESPGSDEPYRSILGIPLKRWSDGTVIGVLSIDSSEPFHFDTDAQTLETNLQPYIVALEATLEGNRA